MNTLELKSIAELQDMAFYIPTYQRGYRWTQQQVKDLLKDILEFSEKKGNAGIYCLQPLVVVKRLSDKDSVMKRIHEAKDLSEVRRLLKEQWEVVDGQQRLTTIRLILEVLQQPHFYNIEYETRKDSASFLNSIMNGIPDSNGKENIDYYHIKQAVNFINDWLKRKDIDRFRNVLLHQVKFIWYETQESNPKEVFTRLNIGKISLTNEN